MSRTLSDLSRTLQRYIGAVLLGGDGALPAPTDEFITWCAPGLPFQPDDFRFAAAGFGGGSAEEAQTLVQKAFDFATMVDFVPAVDRTYSARQGLTGERLTELYGQILRSSRVVDEPLSAERQAQLTALRDRLKADSPIVRAYDEYRQKYVDALLAYNSKWADAQAATGEQGARAVADWSANAGLYRMQVTSALNRWVVEGHRDEVDALNADLGQIAERSMLSWKAQIADRLAEAQMNGLGPGQQFCFTTASPSGFAQASGWARYSVTGHTAAVRGTSLADWQYGTPAPEGVYSHADGAHQPTPLVSGELETEDFELTFSMARVQIIRPWFSPEFLCSRGWALVSGAEWNDDTTLSDGARPPRGRFVGYPAEAIFVRDVAIRSSEFAQTVGASAAGMPTDSALGWGPLSLGVAELRSGETVTDSSVTVSGMQIIGFVNRLFGKTPNLRGGVTPGDLV